MKIISLYNLIHFFAILYPTSLANLVFEVGTRHSQHILLGQPYRPSAIEATQKTMVINMNLMKEQGAVSIRKTVLPGMAIPMLKIRRPNGRLIFNMEITIRR